MSERILGIRAVTKLPLAVGVWPHAGIWPLGVGTAVGAVQFALSAVKFAVGQVMFVLRAVKFAAISKTGAVVGAVFGAVFGAVVGTPHAGSLGVTSSGAV